MEAGYYVCRLCGHREALPSTAAAPAAPRRRLRPSYGIRHRHGPVEPWARSAFNTGVNCLEREDFAGAIDAFRRALDHQSDFVDAHYWLALLLDDPQAKHKHLSTVLAYQPDHLEAVREMMYLSGRLNREQVERLDDFSEPRPQQAPAPVGTRAAVTRCPNCDGDLSSIEGAEGAHCAYCGWQEVRAGSGGAGELLSVALLEYRAQPVKWIIGERYLHCEGCGAGRTLPGHKMSSRCPFCNSNQVVLRDALQSFRAPDGVVPFRVRPQAAEEAIHQALRHPLERLRGFFNSNRIKRVQLQGIYMPFWLFDTVVDVSRTVIDEGRPREGRPINPYSRSTYTELANNVAISGVDSPPQALARRLLPYDYGRIRSYSPKALARFPAELYSIDFVKASLKARTVVGQEMRLKHSRGGGRDRRVNVFVLVRQMVFRLVLLPVWVATVHEEDGDTRLALVNGDSGRAVLGPTEKSG